MGFLVFLKDILMNGKKGIFRFNRDIPPIMQQKIDHKRAVTNVKRIVPFALMIFLIEFANLSTVFITDAYPQYHSLYLVAGILMIFITAFFILLAYRVLIDKAASLNKFKLLYRAFWGLFSGGMLMFIYLELSTRGSTNNYFYLLILTAAFPLLSSLEAAFFFGMDILIAFPLAVLQGFTPHQLLQLLLVTLFALVLSRMLYHSSQMNYMMLEQLEITNQKLSALARTDPLTGLLNRRGIQDQLQECLGQLRNQDIAFFMIDIDLFKNYNDQFGHEQGDQCLKKVAETVQRCVRSQYDFAARFGGEEFLVALIGCDKASVIKTAQWLQQEVIKLKIPAGVNQVYRYITVSIGVATDTLPFDFTDLYERADKALYRAKNNGRNCIASEDALYPYKR